MSKETLDFLTDQISTLEAFYQGSEQLLEFVMEELLHKGALDVFYTPIATTEGYRLKISVLCPQDKVIVFQQALSEILSTRNITITHHVRYKLYREFITLNLYGERVKVKCGYTLVKGQKHYWQAVPEYEDCKSAARAANLPLKLIYELAKSKALEQLNGR